MLSACAATGPAARIALPRGLSVGQIEGPGADDLIRALNSRSSASGEASISGTVSFQEQVTEERETVPVTVAAGKPQAMYKPDPFTERLWRVKETPTATELRDFDFQRLSGEMVFDWQITDKNGAKLDSGRSRVDVNRSFGGFLASQKLAPGQTNPKTLATEARQLLAEEMTRSLALDLGREPSPSEIETAPDTWSREALAAATRNDWEAARALWLEALELNSNFAPALYNLGLYCERDKNPETALEYYQKAFIANGSPLHRAALSRLTESMLRAGYFTE